MMIRGGCKRRRRKKGGICKENL